ncbi:oligopeptide ABC transporter (ATP-binding protein) [[Clostridium] ultunense Esp]|nr:oligopeptide ABC transporter (ATP-binding protein) [[Clostridium] ultunense Esp]
MGKLLNVKNLHTGFDSVNGYIPAVTGVSFGIDEGECVALVGESGSGKSVTAMSILRLLPMPPAKIKADEITFKETDLLSFSEKEMRKVRGNEISMIFQEPMTSLNPLLTVGFQIAEVVRLHLGYGKKEAMEYAIEMLKKVGIPDAKKRADEYSFQMSGGMCQRIMIAMALACEPRLLIADEPTTALDVTIQAQILELMSQLQKERNMAMLLITHNLGIVAEVAERVMVMYAGQIVESLDVEDIFTHPWHPYTHGLLTSIPSVDKKVDELNVIKGVVPSPLFFPKGCRFSPRCPYAEERCKREQPLFTEVKKGHHVRCHYPLSDKRGEINE